MMEILVDLCRDQGKGEVGSGEKSTKKVGDIICAKKSPAVWGNEEKRLFLITYLEDLETENKINEVLIYPFAIYEEDENGFTICLNRSIYKVNLIMFEINDINSEPCSPNEKDYLEKTDLIFDDSIRE